MLVKSRIMSLVVFLSVASLAGAQDSARSIIERVDRILRGDSSHGVATMEVVIENWQREVTMEGPRLSL